jgi:hypothetical protein
MSEGQNGGERSLSQKRDFLIKMPINRNTPSIVDHMFFFQMRTSSSQVPEGAPLDCMLKHWKDIDLDNLCKKGFVFFSFCFCFFALRPDLNIPLEIRKNGLRVGLLTTILFSS